MAKSIGKSILDIIPKLNKMQLDAVGDETERKFKGVSDRTGKYFGIALKAGVFGVVAGIGRMIQKAVTGSIQEAMNNTQALIDKTQDIYAKRVDRKKIGQEMNMGELEVASLEALAIGKNVQFKSIEKMAQGAMKATNQTKTMTISDGAGGTQSVSVKQLIDGAEGKNFMEKMMSLKERLSEENFNILLTSIVGDRDALDIKALLGQFSTLAEYRRALNAEATALKDNGYVEMDAKTGENVGAVKKASFYLSEGSESLNLDQLNTNKDGFIEYLQLMSDAGDNMDKFTTAMLGATIAFEEIAERQREASRALTLRGKRAVGVAEENTQSGNAHFIGQGADPFGYNLRYVSKPTNDPTIQQVETTVRETVISTRRGTR